MSENQSIAVVTVPASEWNETREMIKSISQKVTEFSRPELKEMLTPAEVCRELKFSRPTFERLKNKGVFPVHRTAGAKKIFVKRSDLNLIFTEKKQ